jgi:peptidoglycan hydrolase-like protein with peptidoglycan-binding domain
MSRLSIAKSLRLAAPWLILGLSACTATVESTAPPSTAAAPTSATTPATDEATTTAAPTTAPVPTTELTTTVPTTVAPTTTAAPTTTLPPNYEPVPALDIPLEAVGTNSGPATVAVQNRLIELGFWHAGSDGEYGLTTRQAVMAFQKYSGLLEATGVVDGYTAAFLSATTERARSTADTGTLIEVDKTKQLLFIVVNGRTDWVLNTSTGDGLPYTEPDQNSPGEVISGVSITPDGLWKVDRERPEGWWEGDLGQIYRPKYFRGGVAVHGSNKIPNYPASHGCVRVSLPAMDFIWDANYMPKGTTVWVHGGIPS